MVLKLFYAATHRKTLAAHLVKRKYTSLYSENFNALDEPVFENK